MFSLIGKTFIYGKNQNRSNSINPGQVFDRLRVGSQKLVVTNRIFFDSVCRKRPANFAQDDALMLRTSGTGH